jgi:DNA primase
MAGHIPREFIDELIQRVDLVDLIHSRVPLRKHGRSHIACCPFHQEKTPSFHVNREKQFYYCFGCHATGNIVSFLMEYERAGFIEAIEELAGIAGLSVPYEQGNIPTPAKTNTHDKNADYELLEKVAAFYHQQLFQHPQRQLAVEYLKKRGLSKSIIEQFQIGFAPPGWETLAKNFPTTIKQLSVLGMQVEKEADQNNAPRRYDRFRQRIMFPIRDKRGHVIGFGGRVLSDQDTPKYLNSPETPIFSKGKELYGLHEVFKAHRQISQLIVVEGYMDVISLAQHGVTNAVATLGTSFTESHVQHLFHFSDKILFCFDGDKAGHDAAWRALEQCLPSLHEGRQADFLFLPDGEDPDSFIRKNNVETFYTLVKKAIPLSRFLIHHLAKQVDLTSLDGKASFLSQARTLLKKLPEGMLRELIIDKIAQKIQLPLPRIRELLGQQNPAVENFIAPTAPQSASPQTRLSQQRLSPAKKAISLLLQDPSLAANIELPAILQETDSKEITILVENILIAQCSPKLNTGALLAHWNESPHKGTLAQLALYEHLLSPELWAQEFADCIKKLTVEAEELKKHKLLQVVTQKEWFELDEDLKIALKDLLQE